MPEYGPENGSLIPYVSSAEFHQSTSMPTAEQLKILVSNVIEPCTEKSLGDLRMVRDTFVNGNDARVRIELPTPAYPASKKLEELIRQRIKFAAAELEPRIEMHSTVRGKDAGGRIGLPGVVPGDRATRQTAAAAVPAVHHRYPDGADP